MKKRLYILFFSFTVTTNLFAQTNLLDTSFNQTGTLTVDIGIGNDVATSVAIQNDGKVLVAGSSALTSITSTFDFSLIRINQNGTLDTTFGLNGIITTNFGGSSASASKVLTQTDDKILLVGLSSNFGSWDIALARFDQTGVIDSTFSDDGKLLVNLGFCESGTSAVLQPDGKLLITGNITEAPSDKYFIIRINSDGTLDSTFGINGNVQGPDDFTSTAQEIIMQPDGKILIAGKSYFNFNEDFLISRYLSNGVIDSTFGTNGNQIIDVTENESASTISLTNDGMILVGGIIYNGLNGYDFSLLKFDSTGSIDSTFGNNGIVKTNILTNQDYVCAMELQTDNKIVLAGYSMAITTGVMVVARYNPNGSIDSTFDVNGHTTTQVNNNDTRAYDMKIQNDGKIITVGWTYSNSNPFLFLVARYNSCPTTSYLKKESCLTYSINGEDFSESGMYFQYFTNSDGCDSTVVIDLTINPNTNVTQTTATLIAENENAIYQWINCDLSNNISNSSSNNQVFNPAENGSYAVIINQDGCIDTSECIDFNNLSNNENYSNQISISPNPSAGNFVLQSKNEIENASLKICDVSGKIIYYKENISGNNFQIDLSNQPAGIYFLELNHEGTTQRIKVVKN